MFDPKLLNQLSESIGKTSTVVKGGTDTSEGKSCQLYTLPDTPTGNKTEMCVADLFPIRMVYTFGSLSTTVLLRDFNTTITLERPPL